MLYNKILVDSVSANDLRLWAQVFNLLVELDSRIRANTKLKSSISNCHTFCRLVHHHIPKLKVIDGNYLGLEVLNRAGLMFRGLHSRSVLGTQTKPAYCDHSWLKTPDGAIIDVLPVGQLTLGGMLVPTRTNNYRSFGAEFYFPNQSIGISVMTPRLIKKLDRLIKLFPKGTLATTV